MCDGHVGDVLVASIAGRSSLRALDLPLRLLPLFLLVHDDAVAPSQPGAPSGAPPVPPPHLPCSLRSPGSRSPQHPQGLQGAQRSQLESIHSPLPSHTQPTALPLAHTNPEHTQHAHPRLVAQAKTHAAQDRLQEHQQQ